MLKWLFVVGIFLVVWAGVDKGCREWESMLARDSAVQSIETIQTKNNSTDRNASVSCLKTKKASVRRNQLSTKGGGGTSLTKGQTDTSCDRPTPSNWQSNDARDSESARGDPSGNTSEMPTLAERRHHRRRDPRPSKEEHLVRIE